MNKAEKQKVFSKVKKHLLKQNEKAMKEGDCQYKSPEGLKCAIGCLIQAKCYNKDIEGAPVRWIGAKLNDQSYNFRGKILKNILSKSLSMKITKRDVPFLQNLQEIHDEYEPEFWEEQFESLRKQYRLKDV